MLALISQVPGAVRGLTTNYWMLGHCFLALWPATHGQHWSPARRTTFYTNWSILCWQSEKCEKCCSLMIEVCNVDTWGQSSAHVSMSPDLTDVTKQSQYQQLSSYTQHILLSQSWFNQMKTQILILTFESGKYSISSSKTSWSVAVWWWWGVGTDVLMMLVSAEIISNDPVLTGVVGPRCRLSDVQTRNYLQLDCYYHHTLSTLIQQHSTQILPLLC